MVVVKTGSGRLVGFEQDGILQFRGIPFAAPPVGDLRWGAPRPPVAWSDVRSAASFGAVAPQAASPISSIFGTADTPPMSEDCLTLNVYTPAADTAGRPVLVWIHGGAFTGGSNRNAWYDGTSFARHGVVVVVINYRLGALGFLNLGDGTPGASNRGLLDQVAALEWVRDNIAAFGGNPGNVTIFGESAGAMSVGTLLGMPSAAGLFGRAILQSGAAVTVNSVERSAEVTERMLAKLGGRDGLRGATWESLLQAQGEVSVEMPPDDVLPFAPVADGAVLPRMPMQTIAQGGVAGVPVLIGTNRDEATLFVAMVPDVADMTEEMVVARLDGALAGGGIGQSKQGGGQAAYDAYRSVLGAGARPLDVWVAMESDRRFLGPAVDLAVAQARHTPEVWMYLFTWESPWTNGMLKSCHALEIPFVFDLLRPQFAGFAGSGPAAQALADEMHAAWIAFASAGDPGWPRYTEAGRATRVFGPGAGVVADPMRPRRELLRVNPVLTPQTAGLR
jgi:para-nitrobenzyl esterase